MTLLAADRFYADGAQWIDIATGGRVALVVSTAGSEAEQFAWNHRCGALANLRHTVLNPLVDFGLLDRDRRFEAYACGARVRAGRRSAAEIHDHAAQFLEQRGVVLSGHAAAAALRAVVPGPAATRRPLGYELCPHPAYAALLDAIDGSCPPGMVRVVVAGCRGSGLRTLRLMAARAARLAGYVPIGVEALVARPELVAQSAQRHVCVLAGPEGSFEETVQWLVTRAGSSSARRHLLLEFTRDEVRGAVRMDPMGVTAMTGMVYVHRQHGPSLEEIFRAAQSAGGRPGAFLASLSGGAAEPAFLVARETAPAYRSAAGSGRRPQASGRLEGVLRRSRERGTHLARQGRHAAAARVLDRAARLLAARGARDEAAECAAAHGELLLERGYLDRAADAFDRARELAIGGVVRVVATVGTGRARLLQGRVPEAEAAFRAALVAGGVHGGQSVKAAAAALLAECLCRQRRIDEADVVLGEFAAGVQHADLERARAAIHLARGRIADSTRAAQRSLELARQSGDVRAIAAAWHALATAHSRAGNEPAARAAIEAGTEHARHAHLPVAHLSLRIAALDILGGVSHAIPRGDLLPPLLRADLRDALRARTPAAAAACAAEPNADLERLLEIAQAAENDRAALEKVCAAVLARLSARSVVVVGRPPERRLLAVAGKAWQGEPAASRVLAGESHVAVDPAVQPCFAAMPIRCAGDLLGALACRYAPGSTVHATQTADVLKAAALAIAPAVRGTLERVPGAAAPDAGELLGDSGCMRALRDAVARAARAPFPVLVQGESGSGKELVARAIHRLGTRRERKFSAVNCAALTDDLLEAELFGHARGAFTGAIGERAGLIEDADGGTLFLDEVGELSARAQAKLLRVLQDGEVRRIGENVARRVDVRVVAATNRQLESEVAAGRFRTDLRFRLDVVRIEVPPLRDRPGDVPMLAGRFWHEAAERVGSQATLAPDTLAALARYDWPGNVRELQNVIAWIAVHSPRRGRIGPSALPAHLAGATVPSSCTFEAAREEFERRFVRAALATANGQRGRAADALGVTRQGLAKMIRRLGIEP